MKNKISLVIFDLDGTALGGYEPYAQFPPEFAAFLDTLAANGIRWATNTTWSVELQLEMIRDSGVKSDPVLLTGGSGRFAFIVQENKLLPLIQYHDEIAELDHAFMKKYHILIQSVIKGVNQRQEASEISFDLTGHNIINFKASAGKEEDLWKSLKPLLGNGAYYPFNPFEKKSNTLMPVHMNKGRAVKAIQGVAGVSSKNTVVAGDAFNDLPMFKKELARYMICPANTHPELKKWIISQGGTVASKNYSWGIIEAMKVLLAAENTLQGIAR
jgi:hydroxymethylpyrimidine pyrophosphatase-like HAD family hydrolase